MAAKRYVPFYLFLVGIILSMMTMLKALRHFHIQLSLLNTFSLLLLTTLIVILIGFIAMRPIFAKAHLNRHMQFIYIESMFSVLMAFTACAMVFAHGSNDVAIAVGPIAAIMSLVRSGHTMHNGMMLN
ncbi:MAG: inorganic phosphate transporter, partial [Nitrospirales bacterium]